MKATAEPNALLERLEKKYVKKMETQENKRHSRHVRQSLANMNGLSASYVSDGGGLDRYGIDSILSA